MIRVVAQRSPEWDITQPLPYATPRIVGLFGEDLVLYGKLQNDPLYVKYFTLWDDELSVLRRLFFAGIISDFHIENVENDLLPNQPSKSILQMGAVTTAPTQVHITSETDEYGHISWEDTWYYAAIFENGARHPIGFCASHCPGHATPQEACNHFAEYLSQLIQIHPGHSNEDGGPCAVCGKLTHGYVIVRERQFYFHWYMCEFHQQSKRLYDRLYCRVTPEHGVEMWFRPITRYHRTEQAQEETVV